MFCYYVQFQFRFVYGVRRSGSTANVNGGLVDLDGYDGIRAYQYSLDVGTTDSGFGRDSTGTGVSGPNPIFKMRNYNYVTTTDGTTITTSDPEALASDATLSGSSTSQVLFMGDGREDDSATALSTVSVQSQKYTRCLVCHGSQEFTIPQAQSSGKILLI